MRLRRLPALLCAAAVTTASAMTRTLATRRNVVRSSQALACFVAAASGEVCASADGELQRAGGHQADGSGLPDVMKAVTRASAGQFSFDDSYATPTINSATDVLISIKAAAINPVDYKVGKTLLGPVVGLDFAGVVMQVGSGVRHVSVGDNVYGTAAGSLAEYVVADAGRVSKKPSSLSFEQAAAMPTAYLTGLQALRAGGISNRSKVLVIGASGGCGTAGVQISRALGAKEIVGVCSGRNVEMVRAQGADRVIDYTMQRLEDERAEYDVVYDTATSSGAGEDYRDTAMAVLAPPQEGRRSQYVCINGKPMVWLRYFLGWQELDTQLVLTDANTNDLDLLSRMADGSAPFGTTKKLLPVIFQVLPFEPSAIDDGFALLKSRRVVGKVVYSMQTIPGKLGSPSRLAQ